MSTSQDKSLQMPLTLNSFLSFRSCALMCMCVSGCEIKPILYRKNIYWRLLRTWFYCIFPCIKDKIDVFSDKNLIDKKPSKFHCPFVYEESDLAFLYFETINFSSKNFCIENTTVQLSCFLYILSFSMFFIHEKIRNCILRSAT